MQVAVPEASLLLSCTLLWNPALTHPHLPALEEARDICIYLKPLQYLFEDLENIEFPEVRGQIGPLMHTVCLVWANCRYYCTPPRLIVLLQETCNLLVQQVSRPAVIVYCGNLISGLRDFLIVPVAK